jgi:nitrous oxide reductase accessory protein NosL
MHRASAFRLIILPLVIAACLTTATSVSAAPDPGPSTRLSLQVEADKNREIRTFEGMVAAYKAVRESFGASAVLADLTVVDYATYGSAVEKGLEGRHAFYLVQPTRVRGSADPLNIIAFATRAAASRHQQKVGGQVLTFEDVWNRAEKYHAAQAAAAAIPAAEAPQPEQRQEGQPRRRSTMRSSSNDDCNT